MEKVQEHDLYYPIKNYSGVSVEFRQIKAAMGVPKQQMLPSFWSDNSTAITGDYKHPIVCDFGRFGFRVL